jgi:cyclic beta-1,2-glucan synthetase
MRSPEGVEHYRTEPYAVAADVYAHPLHVGRGGWTWYTGSAGWMQRAGLEGILGLRRRGDHLELEPCIPPTWPRFEISLRHGASRYQIVVENPASVSRGIATAHLDGAALDCRPLRVRLADDGAVHRLDVTLG